MKMIVKACAAAFALALVQGCATSTNVAQGSGAQTEFEQRQQARFVVKTRHDRQRRLEDLSFPILRDNVELCPRTRRKGGYNLTSRHHFSDAHPVYADAWRDIYGLRDDRVYVVGVTSGSPAEKAGLVVGDAIVEIEGEPVREAKSKRAANRELKRVSKLLDEGYEDGVLEMTVLQKGTLIPKDVRIEPVEVCDYPVNMVDSNDINAYADGNAIYITTGMVRFAETDLDLQSVVAHELAHNTEKHIDKTLGNQMLGGFIGAILDGVAASQGIRTDMTNIGMEAGKLVLSQDFEREADYIGTYFLERAGIDASESADLWRRVAAESGAGVVYGTTHPTTPERFVNVSAAVQEIRAKQAAGQELLPNRKKDDGGKQ